MPFQSNFWYHAWYHGKIVLVRGRKIRISRKEIPPKSRKSEMISKPTIYSGLMYYIIDVV